MEPVARQTVAAYGGYPVNFTKTAVQGGGHTKDNGAADHPRSQLVSVPMIGKVR